MTAQDTFEAELLTVEDASHLLNLKVSRIRKAVFKREVKYIKLGALIRFKKDHLLEWINKCTVSTRVALR
jgi:excisionase family DNA binding protein